MSVYTVHEAEQKARCMDSLADQTENAVGSLRVGVKGLSEDDINARIVAKDDYPAYGSIVIFRDDLPSDFKAHKATSILAPHGFQPSDINDKRLMYTNVYNE